MQQLNVKNISAILFFTALVRFSLLGDIASVVAIALSIGSLVFLDFQAKKQVELADTALKGLTKEVEDLKARIEHMSLASSLRGR